MYAKVGGISTKELNILEIEFLFLIDWNLAANVETLQNYYVNLVKQVNASLIQILPTPTQSLTVAQHPSFTRIVKPLPPPTSTSSHLSPTLSSPHPYAASQQQPLAPSQPANSQNRSSTASASPPSSSGPSPSVTQTSDMEVDEGGRKEGVTISDDIEWVD